MTSRITAVFACLLGCAVCYAQPLTQPRIGAGRDAHGRWRTVSGLGGTFLTGPALFENVLAGASSGSRHVVQTSTDLLVADFGGTVLARQAMSSSPTVLGVSATGNSALAWISGTSTLLLWRAGEAEWSSVPVAVHGSVVALATDGTLASLIVRQEDRWSRLTVHLASRSTTAEVALQRLSGVVQVAANGDLLWAEGRLIHQVNSTSGEAVLSLPETVISLAALGPDWWQVTCSNGQIGAMRFRGGELEWFELPAGDEQ